MIAGMEFIVVAGIVLVVLFFGKDKVIGWAKAIGEAKKAYKEASEDKPEENKE